MLKLRPVGKRAGLKTIVRRDIIHHPRISVMDEYFETLRKSKAKTNGNSSRTCEQLVYHHFQVSESRG
jgi:hypothetical protein